MTQLSNNYGQSPYAVPTDELTVYFDGLAVQSPTTGSCLYSPQQMYSTINAGSPQSFSFLNTNPNFTGSPQSPSFLNTNPNFLGSPQSPSFLNTNQTFVGTPQSPFLNANTLFGSPTNQLYSENNYVDIPFMNGLTGSPTDQNSCYVGSPSNQVFSGNQIYGGNSYLGSPTASNVQSYVGSPNSSHFLNSPVMATTIGGDSSEETSNNALGIANYLSPITTPSPTSSYTGPASMLFPPTNALFTNQESNTSRPTSPLPDDVILTTSEVSQYFQLQPDLAFSADVVQPISPHNTQPQKRKINNRKSTVKSTTPSGRKAKIHKCPYCQHTSNRANNMREHIQIHDPNRPKPHTCKLCHKSFARKHDMNRHVLSCKKSKKSVV